MRFSKALIIASMVMSTAVFGTEARAVAYNVDYEFLISGTMTGVASYGPRYCGYDPTCSSEQPYQASFSFTARNSSYEDVWRDGNLFTFDIGGPFRNFTGSFLFDGGAGAITPISLNYNYYAGTSTCNFGDGLCMVRAGTSNFQVVQTRGPFGPVPEPTTWAMMLAGFGAVGFATRRPRQSVSVSYA